MRLRVLRHKKLSWPNKLGRVLWGVVWFTMFRPSPVAAHAWRRFLLQMFGAKIGKPAYLYPSVKIWAPWNLVMGDHSTLARNVDCYCVDKVEIGSFTTVSQYCYLCTASHDYSDPCIEYNPQMQLITAPILLGDRVWLTADVFVGPGVSIGDGAVVLARSTVVHDLQPWVVAAGNPAKMKKKRILRTSSDLGNS